MDIYDNTFSVDSRDVKKIENQIKEFNDSYVLYNKAIKEISNNLMGENGFLNYNMELDYLTNKVSELDDLIKNVNADLRIFLQNNEDSYDFIARTSLLVDRIVELKENLKNLKVLQVSNYVAKIDSVNKKIREIKSLSDDKLPADVLMMIASLREFDKDDYVVTDWKYSKYRRIEFKKIDATFKNISLIEDKLRINKTSFYVDKLDSMISNINSRINEINVRISNIISLNDVNIIKEELKELSGLVYAFGTELYLNKDNINDIQHNGYKDKIIEFRSKMSSLNQNLSNNYIYKNVKEELVNELKVVNTRVDSFCRYVNLHYRNANDEIVEFDKLELSVILDYVEIVKEKVLSKKDILVKSQYDRFMVVISKMEERLNDAKKKINNSLMLKKFNPFDECLKSMVEIEEGLDEIEEKIKLLSNPIDKEEMKFVYNGIKYLEYKINDVRGNLDKFKDEDIKQYELLKKRVNRYMVKLNNVALEYKKRKPSKVIKVKSGKDVLSKYNKLILITGGLAITTLLLHKVILIPAVMHGNMMISQLNPSLDGMTSLFNNVLGSVVGASVDAKGIWHLANGSIINSSVATTSLLKGLIVGFTGSAVTFVSVLVVAIKQLVEKMKIKERKQKVSKKNVDSIKKESAKDKLRKIKEIVEFNKNKNIDNVNVGGQVKYGRSNS